MTRFLLLTAAMDPAIAERAGEVLDSLAVLADMADLFSAPLLDDDDKPEMTVALERIVAAVPALLAQNAALRAERDEFEGVIKHRREPSIVGAVGRALRMKSEAEARAEAAEAVAEKLRRALRDIEADCDADYPPSHGAIKQAARAALSATTEASHE